MIEVEKALVVCEKHYESHFMEFAACPYCQVEMLKNQIAELRADLVKAEGAVANLMKVNEKLVEILEDKSWFGGESLGIDEKRREK